MQVRDLGTLQSEVENRMEKSVTIKDVYIALVEQFGTLARYVDLKAKGKLKDKAASTQLAIFLTMFAQLANMLDIDLECALETFWEGIADDKSRSDEHVSEESETPSRDPSTVSPEGAD